LGANPGTLFADGVDKVGQTSVSWQAGKPVVTFPIPGVAGATATATLDVKYMTEKVVVTQGQTTTEFTYSGYKDWNNPLNKIEVFYAGKLTERKNGAIVRDLTTDVTETWQCVCHCARAGQREEGDHGHRADSQGCVREARGGGEQVGAHTATRRAS
jgi:hypothetical protein